MEKVKEDLEAAEGLNDEAQAEIKDLKSKNDYTNAELKKIKEELETVKKIPPPPPEPPPQKAVENFLPTEEKLQAIFRKIDAILE